jgi:helix-turn-helix protein/uncharacterized protein DUF4115
MTPVGQVLKDARMQQGTDLGEVERVTKIRVKFLRAMEEEHWDELPAPVYARGFLSTYADYLGLDGAPLVEEYRRTEGDEPEPIPIGAIRAGGVHPRRRPVKPILLGAGGLLAAALIALAIASALGGSGDGDHRAARKQGEHAKSVAPPAASTPGSASRISVELRSTAEVWVCLVKSGGRPLVAETLAAGESRGPFRGRAFEVTFGNGSVELSVDGTPADVPPLAQPLGFRITHESVRRLDPSASPTCT